MAASTKKKYGKDVPMSSPETLLMRVPDRVLSESPKVSVINIGFGVNIYRDALSKETCQQHIDTLNRELDGLGPYSWLSPEPGRNAIYFLTTEDFPPAEDKNSLELRAMHDVVFTLIKQCIEDYAASWKIGINHYEPLSFAKYSYPHNSFDYHIDDSPDVPRTVSAVVYLNDDYIGGELNFSRLEGLNIKPRTGDIIVFPSNYLYEHESKPVLEGTKYAVATFTHYKQREEKDHL